MAVRKLPGSAAMVPENLAGELARYKGDEVATPSSPSAELEVAARLEATLRVVAQLAGAVARAIDREDYGEAREMALGMVEALLRRG